ncbi:hypothetical protein A0H81_01735 [Grifola frondosa]|uniref:Uncharacterized protein n=1 Tax=Grifola frondosa TaxID=5627 RepID=A0A1C7MN67_GRIFR|nr:hypothetical protein A0H81_01735 [Grifola frondosa]
MILPPPGMENWRHGLVTPTRARTCEDGSPVGLTRLAAYPDALPVVFSMRAQACPWKIVVMLKVLFRELYRSNHIDKLFFRRVMTHHPTSWPHCVTVHPPPEVLVVQNMRIIDIAIIVTGTENGTSGNPVNRTMDDRESEALSEHENAPWPSILVDGTAGWQNPSPSAAFSLCCTATDRDAGFVPRKGAS